MVFKRSFQSLETHSKLVLFYEDAWFSVKMTSFHKCGKSALARFIETCLMVISQTPQNKRLKIPFLQNIFYSVNEHQSQWWFPQESNPSHYPKTMLYLGWMSHSTDQCSACPGGLKEVSLVWNPLKMCSPLWRSLNCYEMPTFHKQV